MVSGRWLYRARHAVECGISLLEQHHAAATRFDTLAVRCETTARITTINTWLRHSWNTA